MLKKLPIKKDHSFLIAIVLMLVVGYQLAFKRTFDAWQTNESLNSQLALSTSLTYHPGYAKRKNANLDSAISRYKVDTINFRNNSIAKIAAIAGKQNVDLSEVPVQDPILNTEKFTIQKLTLEGNFFSLTKTLDRLQTTGGIGVIRSASYRLTRTEEGKLFANVYVEILK